MNATASSIGVASWKMVPLALLPLGSRVVPVDQADRDPYGVPSRETSRT